MTLVMMSRPDGALPRAAAAAFLAENGPPDRFPGARKPRDIYGQKKHASLRSRCLLARIFPPEAGPGFPLFRRDAQFRLPGPAAGAEGGQQLLAPGGSFLGGLVLDEAVAADALRQGGQLAGDLERLGRHPG